METTKTVLAPGERITVIDALRGFSLIGICLIHSMQHFGAMGTMTSQAVFPWEGTMNEIFSWLINYLVFGKFFIIFSCLFGLSFFIQMDRVAKKGLDFRPRFFVEAGSFVGDRLFTRLDCPGGYFADICDTGVCFGVDV